MKKSVCFFTALFCRVLSMLISQEATPSGAFTYNYPIDIPEGPNGLTPNVSLVYNSQAGNGLAGLGWTLTGFPVISRDPSYPINWDDSDHFLYDGQKLIPDGDGFYHTERESFEKIEYVKGSNPYWSITKQDGTVLLFGKNSGSRIKAIGKGNITRLWALEIVRDVQGNNYQIYYDVDTTNGDYYPSRVLYTWFQSFPGSCIIEFSYESRKDSSLDYAPRSVIMDKRLKEIAIYTRESWPSLQKHYKKKYRIDYLEQRDWSDLSKIKSITPIGYDDNNTEIRGNSTQFSWDNKPFDYYENNAFSLGNPINLGDSIPGAHTPYRFADFTGDGLCDMMTFNSSDNTLNIFPSNGRGFSTCSDSIAKNPLESIYLGDFNGDNHVDILSRRGGSLSIRLIKNGKFQEVSGVKSNLSHSSILIADETGDGVDDIILSSGGNTTVYPVKDGQILDNFPQSSPRGISGDKWLGDFDGDGTKDILSWKNEKYNDKIYIYSIKNGVVTNRPIYEFVTEERRRESELIVGDFNGDSIDDLVIKKGYNAVIIFLKDGNITKKFIDVSDYSADVYTTNIYSCDYNADGMSDLLFDCHSKNICLFYNEQIQHSSLSVNQHRMSWKLTSDFTGDGIPDYLYKDSGNLIMCPIKHNYNSEITSIQNLSGPKIYVEYKYASSCPNAIKPDESNYPYITDLNTRRLVTLINFEANDENIMSSTFAYYNGKSINGYKHERKSLGFEWIKKTKPDGTAVRTYYYQEENDSLYAGLVKRQEIFGSDSKLYSATEYTYAASQHVAQDDNYHAVNFIKLTNEYGYTFNGVSYYSVWNTIKNLSNKIKTRKYYEYDRSLGTFTKVINYGDLSNYKDDLAVITTYIHDNDSNITVPKTIRNYSYPLFGGSPYLISVGNLTGAKNFYYDGQNGTLGALGSGSNRKGLVTRIWEDSGETDKSKYPDSNKWITYDSYGNIATVKDALGNVTTLSYDNTFHSSLSSVRNASNQVTETCGYDNLGRLRWTMDINGNYTWYTYDAFSRVYLVSDGTSSGPGRTLSRTTYADIAAPSAYPQWVKEDVYSPVTTGDNNYITTYSYYDPFGNILQTKTEGLDENGSSGWIGVSYYHNLETGEERVYEPKFYTGSGYNPLSQASEKFTVIYKDKIGRSYKTVYPDGSEEYTKYGLYDRFNLTLNSDGMGMLNYQKADGRSLKSYSYPEQRLSYSDLNYFNTQSWSYMTETLSGADGSIVKETGNDSDRTHSLETRVDQLGRKLSYADPNMGEWHYEYDANGNLIKQTDSKNNQIKFEYDALNRVTKKVGARTTIYCYDGKNADGSVDSEDHGPDVYGRLTKLYYTDNSYSESYYYHDDNQFYTVTKTIDGKSRTVKTTLDDIGRVVKEITPTGESLKYEYRKDGNLLVVGTDVNAANYIEDLRYNIYGQIEYYLLGNGSSVDYSYNDKHHLKNILIKDQANKRLASMNFEYDEWGNVTYKNFDDDFGSYFTENLQYDPFLRLETANSNGLYDYQEYHYDDYNNITEKDGFTYEYNGTGPHQVTAIKDSSGSTVKTYEYDANGNIEKITGQSHIVIRAKGTGIASQPPIMELWLGGVKTDSTWIVNSADYQNYYWHGVIPAGATVDVVFKNDNAAGGVDSNLLIDYIDINGEKIQSDSSYVTIDRGAYSSGCFDGVNTISGQENLAWTGAMRFFVTPDAQGTERKLYYDKENRLTTITDNGATTATYAYDPSGQRIRTMEGDQTIYHYFDSYEETHRLISRSETEITKTTYYFANGQRIAYREAKETKNTSSGHKLQPIGTPFTIISDTSSNGTAPNFNMLYIPESEVYYYHQDHLGSSVRITDSQGAPVQSLAYDPYGKITWYAGKEGNRITFTGQEQDDTGFMYYRARYYDPDLGRFLQADTYLDGMNRYAYCGNNPVKYVDPTGHFAWGYYLSGGTDTDPQHNDPMLPLSSGTGVDNDYNRQNRQEIRRISNRIKTLKGADTLDSGTAYELSNLLYKLINLMQLMEETGNDLTKKWLEENKGVTVTRGYYGEPGTDLWDGKMDYNFLGVTLTSIRVQTWADHDDLNRAVDGTARVGSYMGTCLEFTGKFKYVIRFMKPYFQTHADQFKNSDQSYGSDPRGKGCIIGKASQYYSFTNTMIKSGTRFGTTFNGDRINFQIDVSDRYKPSSFYLWQYHYIGNK